MLRRIQNITICILVCVLITACRKDDTNSISMTYVTSPLNVPSIIEKENGLLSEITGCNINYVNLTSGPDQTQALASGDVHILNAVGISSVISAASNGADIKIISAYGRSPRAFKLFSGRNKIETAKDLEGKKIAGPKGSTLYELLLRYFERENISIEAVEFVALEIPEARAALESGAVDAALLAGPNAYQVEKEGYSVITTGEGLVDGLVVTATTEEFAEKYPCVIDHFRQMQTEVLEYVDENYDQTVRVVSRATDLSEEAVEEMMPLYDFSPGMTNHDKESVEKTYQFMKENNLINRELDIERLFL